MWGIVGIFTKEKNKARKSVLKNLCNSVAHRGPDCSELFSRRRKMVLQSLDSAIKD